VSDVPEGQQDGDDSSQVSRLYVAFGFQRRNEAMSSGVYLMRESRYQIGSVKFFAKAKQVMPIHANSCQVMPSHAKSNRRKKRRFVEHGISTNTFGRMVPRKRHKTDSAKGTALTGFEHF
jgi:hypothetical protein